MSYLAARRAGAALRSDLLWHGCDMTNAGTDVIVPARRVRAWLDGFARRNGEIVQAEADPRSLQLSTDRGGTASFELAISGYRAGGTSVSDHLDGLVEWALSARTLAVVLVRRGGYTVGDVEQPAGVAKAILRASKTGTRYVQGRTAAGGQSQQRFARRRANQADALVVAAQNTAFGVLGGRAKNFDVLVLGGDQELLDQVLSDPRLAWLSSLPVVRQVEVGDPRQRTIDEAVIKALCVRVHVTNAPLSS